MPKTRLKVVCAAVLIGAVTAAVGAQQPATPAILAVRAAELPAYTAYPDIRFYAATPAEYAAAAADRAFVMEKITYRSDGLEVYAYLYRPATPPTDRRMPVVVFNRGSYTRDEFVPEVLMPGRRLAQRGYLVIAPMLRGSGGAAGHDEMGGADLNDVFNILPVIREIRYADPARIFMYGQSRGGIMTLLAAKNGFPARAMATWGAITDIEAYLAADTGGRRAAPMIWPDFETNKAAIFESRSAINWPERISVPLLLMNGGADGQVSPTHALRLADALQKLGKPYELKVFYGEYHSIATRAQERDEDAMRWFARFDGIPQ